MSWRDSKGAAVASRGPSPIILVDRFSHPQLAKVDVLISALQAARLDASRGLFFASHSGKAAVNAMFDLTEVDGLYTLQQDVAHELGESVE